MSADKSELQKEEPLRFSTTKRILNAVGFVILVVFNALGSAGVLTGFTVGQVSDMYLTQITPAGYAFSIWGLIYFFQASFVIWNLFPKQATSKLLVEKISWFFFIQCIFNTAWIMCFSFGNDISSQISAAIISLLLLFILIIYVRAECWRRVPSSALEFLVVDVHFSLYAGWVTVATVVNIAIAFVAAGNVDFLWGVSATTWAIIALSLALVINLLVVLTRRDFVFPIVLVWAISAIREKNIDNEPVALTCLIILFLALFMALGAFAIRIYQFYSAESNDENKNGVDGQKAPNTDDNEVQKA